MEQAQKLSELIDEFKEKISDKEYKDTLEAVGELINVKRKEVFVKVKRISCETIIYTKTVKDDDEEYESDIINTSDRFVFDMCRSDCECGDCSHQPLKTVEVKSKMKEKEMWMKVVEDREYRGLSPDVMGRHIFGMLKRNKTMSFGNGDILVYLEDNE